MNILLSSAHSLWDYEFACTGHNIVRLFASDRYLTPVHYRPPAHNMKSDSIHNAYKYKDWYDVLIISHPDHYPHFKGWGGKKILVAHAVKDINVLSNICDEVDSIVHVCNYSKEIANLNTKKPQYVIHNAVTPENYCVYDVENTDKSIVVSCIGFVERRELFPNDALGYELYKDVTRDFVTMLLGGGNEIITGSVMAYPVRQMSKVMTQSRVFFNSTLDSLFPTAILDAMACGMPIVSTYTTGIPEMLEHDKTALVSNDPNELKEYIKLLLNDKKECARLSANARQKVIEHFNSDRMAKEWNQIINSVFYC